MLDVLLAAPDHLDGTVDLLGNFDREKGTIWLKPTAEASTQILIVDHNGFLRHSSERRDRACVTVGCCVPTQISQMSFR